MSVPQPSRFTRNALKIASLGLAGLIVGLLSGCSPADSTLSIRPRIDTDWQTSPTYASAVASAPINRHSPSGRIHEAQSPHATPTISPHRAHL
jgi:hypothetical protein